MTDQRRPDADEFIRLLTALRDARSTESGELTRSLAAVRELRADGTADDEHDPEGPTLSAEWSRISGLHGELAAKDAEIERAFERLSAGTFGSCIRCGLDVGIERLRARPAAELCISCARDADARRR